MANLNDNIDKAKNIITDTAKKAQESETYAKVKNTANEVTEKIKENEKVANAVEKINQNEYVQKVNKSKYSKFIKIGIGIIAIILIFNIFSFIFSDKKVKAAQDYMISEITSLINDDGGTDGKVRAKAIGKNTDAELYAFDTNITYKKNGKNYENNSFIIVCYSDDLTFIYRQYEYEKGNKRDMKDVALATLSKG